MSLNTELIANKYREHKNALFFERIQLNVITPINHSFIVSLYLARIQMTLQCELRRKVLLTIDLQNAGITSEWKPHICAAGC